MEKEQKATSIDLFSFNTPQMRAFHMSWFAFLLCFLGWFAIPALSKQIIDELGITKHQFVTTSQFAVGSTILMRLLIGWLCDKVGARITYTYLLIFGSIPVAASAFIQNYEQLLFARIFIGAIGASFVITQYHTSKMFAPNCVGTANATTAGWGNLGGGLTQLVMPLLMMGFAIFFPEKAWRYAMLVPALVMIITGIAYYKLTQDTPAGNIREEKKKAPKGLFFEACKDYRVWSLFIIYGACFGMELIVNSKISLYLQDDYHLNLKTAMWIGMSFGLMNLFARTLGGLFGDRFGHNEGLKGRVKWLFIVLFIEGITLMVFSQMSKIAFLIPSLVLFSLFVQMSEGATFSVVPFINKKALGPVAGIVGAGGNAGAVAGMFLFKIDGFAWSSAFFVLGVIVMVISFLAFSIRFTEADELEAKEYEASLMGSVDDEIDDEIDDDLEPTMA